MDRSAWRGTVHEVEKSWTRLSNVVNNNNNKGTNKDQQNLSGKKKKNMNELDQDTQAKN